MKAELARKFGRENVAAFWGNDVLPELIRQLTDRGIPEITQDYSPPFFARKAIHPHPFVRGILVQK
jgi:hypothetical protein